MFVVTESPKQNSFSCRIWLNQFKQRLMTISEIMIILIIIAYFEDIMLCVKLSNFLNAFLFKLKIL